jgi:hypothetical protein
MQIDLVYFEGCPHVVSARQRIADALGSLGLSAEWSEWDTGEAATPTNLRGYSSPTVLVNGVDVEHKAATSGASCAVGGGPSLEVLRAALTAASR